MSVHLQLQVHREAEDTTTSGRAGSLLTRYKQLRKRWLEFDLEPDGNMRTWSTAKLAVELRGEISGEINGRNALHSGCLWNGLSDSFPIMVVTEIDHRDSDELQNWRRKALAVETALRFWYAC